MEIRQINKNTLLPWSIYKWITITTLLTIPINSHPSEKIQQAVVTEKEIFLETRPTSPVKAILTLPRWTHENDHLDQEEVEYDYFDPKVMFWTPWEYCEGNTFLAGVQGMIFNPHRDPEMQRIRFNCESPEGYYTGDVYAGVGNVGAYGEPQKCHGISAKASIGFDRISTSSDCSTFAIVSVNLRCLRPGNWSATLATTDTSSWWIHYDCPPGTALCGLRAKVLSYGKKFTDCSWKSSGSERFRPHMLRLEFACCQLRLPGDNCNVKYLWETRRSCQKNSTCRSILISVLVESSVDVTIWRRILDTTEGLNNLAKWGSFTFAVNSKYSHKGLDGTNGSDILRGVTTRDQAIPVDMTGCDGSLQQLSVKCGPYDARSRHFRCLELTE